MRFLEGTVSWQTPDKLDVALARLIQFGIFTQTLVVDGERYNLGLLELKPVHSHLKQRKSTLSCASCTFMSLSHSNMDYQAI